MTTFNSYSPKICGITIGRCKWCVKWDTFADWQCTKRIKRMTCNYYCAISCDIQPIQRQKSPINPKALGLFKKKSKWLGNFFLTNFTRTFFWKRKGPKKKKKGRQFKLVSYSQSSFPSFPLLGKNQTPFKHITTFLKYWRVGRRGAMTVVNLWEDCGCSFICQHNSASFTDRNEYKVCFPKHALRIS